MGDTTMPPPPDPTAGMAMTAMASMDKTRTQVGGAIQMAGIMAGVQIHQANTQALLGMEMLNTKETLGLAQIEAGLEKAGMRHDENMKDLDNDELAIKKDAEDNDSEGVDLDDIIFD